MSKQIIYSNEAREKMLTGMETVSKTVSVTIGPKGRNVIFDKGNGQPQVTNDGVTIAKEIDLEDAYQNMGAQLVIEAADKTNTIAGDGTTTATLLTYALASEGLKHIRDGINAIELKNGMKKAAQAINEELEKNTKTITSKEEISQVASLSAQDEVVGEIIAEAMEKVGNNGVITVEEGHTFGLEVEITEGMEIENGYISPYMVDDTEKMLSKNKDISILITDSKISSTNSLLPLLEKLVSVGKKDLFIIAEDIDGEALNTIILNKLKGILNVVAIKAPGFGENKKDVLNDIAILTGANLINSDLGMKIENTSLEDLGEAKTIISSKEKTTIIGGAGDKEDIDSRVIEIKNLINKANGFEKQLLIRRIAKLDGGVAVIKVGAASEVEMKEKKLRIEDALNATKAAVEEGVVAGGGVALLKASRNLSEKLSENKNEQIGVEIVRHALTYPTKQIAKNSGKDSSEVIENILSNNSAYYGYDAANDEYLDMIENGIIDPKKVERVALQEAVSLAGMFLTTEAAITKKKSNDNPLANLPNLDSLPMM